MGFMKGTAAERIYREVKVMTIGGGTEETMKELASRQLGPSTRPLPTSTGPPPDRPMPSPTPLLRLARPCPSRPKGMEWPRLPAPGDRGATRIFDSQGEQPCSRCGVKVALEGPR